MWKNILDIFIYMLEKYIRYVLEKYIIYIIYIRYILEDRTKRRW